MPHARTRAARSHQESEPPASPFAPAGQEGEPEGGEESGADRRLRFGLPTRERDFLVPAKDAKGASARVWCRVTPEVTRLISDIIAARKFPFRLSGDLMRWAIVDAVKRLGEGAGIPSVLAQSDAIRAMLTDEEYHLDFAHNFSTLKRVTERYIERGAHGKAREVVLQFRDHIRGMPEGYWRDQYLAELGTRYNKLLDDAERPMPGVSPFDPSPQLLSEQERHGHEPAALFKTQTQGK